MYAERVVISKIHTATRKTHSMADFYKTLGVDPTASKDQIKAAYRKLASIHHPDKGGDTAKFQEIQAAYDALTGNRLQPQQQSHSTHRWHHYNSDYVTHAHITVEQAINGAELKTVIGDRELVINMPKGVLPGQQIRVTGQGSCLYADQPPGDLIIIIHYDIPSGFEFDVFGNIYYNFDINCIDAVLGVTVTVTTMDRVTLEVKIPASLQPNQHVNAGEYGMPSSNGKRGKFILVPKFFTPAGITPAQLSKLQGIVT